MSTYLHYAVEWRCEACGAAGEAAISTDEGCTELFDRVVGEHRERSPECEEKFGDTKLAISPPPQKSQNRLQL